MLLEVEPVISPISITGKLVRNACSMASGTLALQLTPMLTEAEAAMKQILRGVIEAFLPFMSGVENK